MALTTREDDFSAWYNELVEQAQLAQNSAVRWCMVIRPYGYAIWENMQKNLDGMFKATGHQNAYFPLLIPKSFFSKEAKHVDGFAKEAAVVTHYRLRNDGKGWIEVDPEAKLEEELIIRPTSETIIRNTYKDRIQSYRDLPILVNQRANVMRREMRTRLFLRTAEFLRQEGHTAHATAQEAIEETKKMRNVYQDFFRNFLAVSWVAWEKSENERFAGAENTYCVEAFMQDGKALQIATSHYLWQNFAKAFDVTFINQENKPEYVYATSWWVSTRMMWGLIMSHSDDKGLVLPPAVAPIHVVIVPIRKTDDEKAMVQTFIEKKIVPQIQSAVFTINSEFLGDVAIPLQIKVDRDDQKSPGRKYNQYELQWVPVRIAVGPRDVSNGTIELVRRDTGVKQSIAIAELQKHMDIILPAIQHALLERNETLRIKNTVTTDNYEDFKRALDEGKFVMAHWDGTVETEELIKEETKATIRCIPSETADELGVCIRTGHPSKKRVLFARAY